MHDYSGPAPSVLQRVTIDPKSISSLQSPISNVHSCDWYQSQISCNWYQLFVRQGPGVIHITRNTVTVFEILDFGYFCPSNRHVFYTSSKFVITICITTCIQFIINDKETHIVYVSPVYFKIKAHGFTRDWSNYTILHPNWTNIRNYSSLTIKAEIEKREMNVCPLIRRTPRR